MRVSRVDYRKGTCMYIRFRYMYTCTFYFLLVHEAGDRYSMIFTNPLTCLVLRKMIVGISVARLGDLIVSRSVATTCVRIDFYPSEVIVNRPSGV